MPVGRCVMRTAESAVLTPWPPGPEARKTSTRISSSRTLTSTSSTSGMDREDRRFRVVGARHHDLQLELVEVSAEAGDLGGDLGIEAPVVRLGRELKEHGEVLGAGDELLQPADAPAELGALPNELLGAAVVLPEGGRRHPGVERGEPLLFRRNVKDAPGAR